MSYCLAWYSDPMIYRLVVSALVTISLVLAITPRPALAHGMILKGAEIDHNMYLHGSTGSCICDDRWFTMGLAPGTVKIIVQLQHCGTTATKTCAIEAYLSRGKTDLGAATPACFSSQKHCNRSQTITYHVKQRGAYYLLLRGAGSLLIYFSLRINGNVYPLHCHKYC